MARPLRMCHAGIVPAASATRVRRTDYATLRPVERRDDGTLLADAYLTRCGVFQYHQPDGSIRRELRRRQDVADPTSLRTLEGRPVTNDHPPGMIDARSAREWAVGAQTGAVVMDDDRVRSRISIYDDQTVRAMNGGKVEISCGYTCDCLETPGVDPVYGAYDAIQTGIEYNHIAIVDHGRAGSSVRARMDGWAARRPRGDGMTLASPVSACNTRSMARIRKPIARTDAPPGAEVDPDDEAARNAAGANDAPGGSKKPGAVEADAPRDDDDEDPDDEPSDEVMDAYASMYDDDGNLTPASRSRMAAGQFAIPDKERLPIHDAGACKGAMRQFGEHQFDDADQRHAAFNRITGRAKQFGVSTSRFERAYGPKLDRAGGPRNDTTMTEADIKALQAKAAKRKTDRDTERTRADAAETRAKELEGKVANLEGQVASLTRDVDTAKKGHMDSKAIDELVAKRAELVATATKHGATVTAAMPETEIKRAVIKHLDKEDVAADAHPQFVEALYLGALKRATTDAVAVAAGAGAANAARGAGSPTAPIVPPPAPEGSTFPTESEVAARMRGDSANAWSKRRSDADTFRGGY